MHLSCFSCFASSVGQPFYLQPRSSKVQQQAQLESRRFDIVEGLYIVFRSHLASGLDFDHCIFHFRIDDTCNL
jgi:hypothetical protein